MATKHDIETIVKDIFASERQSYNDHEIELSYGRDNKDVRIVVERMYSYVEVQFSHLQDLSELFQTQNINIGDRDFYSGCETCDHGSSYRVTIVVRDITVPIE